MMIISADKTEIKALRILAKAVKSFEALLPLKISRDDEYEVCDAYNTMKSIVESNGYSIIYDSEMDMIIDLTIKPKTTTL